MIKKHMKKYIAIFSILALALTISPVLAFGNSDIVYNENEAFVGNHVGSTANTGLNRAGGSRGGEGGEGGDVEAEGEGGNLGNDNTGGDGGMGGDGSIGGTVITGDATARAGAINVVNTNRTNIDRCCEEDMEEPQEPNNEECCEEECCDDGMVLVINRNRGASLNGVFADANTGLNEAKGSKGGEGGEGGEVEVEEGGNAGNGNTGGTGGTGGMGGDGGYVETGVSVSEAGVINVINRNVTRIRR